MRMYEVANAEDQLALWQLINQSVWAAIEQQRVEQQRVQQQAAQKHRSKAPTTAVRPTKAGRAATPFRPVPVQTAAVPKPLTNTTATAAAVPSQQPNNSKRKDSKDSDADNERDAVDQRENSDFLLKTRKQQTKQQR
jgi:GAF domain-containing protein